MKFISLILANISKEQNFQIKTNIFSQLIDYNLV